MVKLVEGLTGPNIEENTMDLIKRNIGGLIVEGIDCTKAFVIRMREGFNGLIGRDSIQLAAREQGLVNCKSYLDGIEKVIAEVRNEQQKQQQQISKSAEKSKSTKGAKK